MRKIITILFFNLLILSVTAQSYNDYLEVQRAALKTEKKAIIAEAMQFTDSESDAFWPLYNEYNDKMYSVNTKIFKLIEDYAARYETMSDEKAVDLWNQSVSYDLELLKLKKTYFKKFHKILPGQKVVRYFQAENKIRALVDAQLALDIPLVEL